MKTRTRRRPSIETLESRSLLTAGALDATFGAGGGLNYPHEGVPQVAVQPWDSKIIAAEGNPSDELDVNRYNTNGTLDTSFGAGGLAIVNVGTKPATVAIIINPATRQIDIVGDTLVKGSGALSFYNFFVTRLNANGTVDTTFGANGSVTVSVGKDPWDLPSAAALDSLGRLVVVGGDLDSTKAGEYGYYAYQQDTILRFTTTGQLDTSFGNGGQVNGPLGLDTRDAWNAVLINPDNSITVSGQDTRQSVIASYSSTGASASRNVIQTPVNPYNSTQNIGLGDTTFLPNGDLVSVGTLNNAENSDVIAAVVRYTPTGTVDTSFGNGGLTTTDLTATLGVAPSSPLGVGSVAIDPTGRIVVEGGYSPMPYGNEQELIARYAPGGMLDSSFGDGGLVVASPGLYGNSQVENLTTQPDGNILTVALVSASYDNQSGYSAELARFLGNSSPSAVVTQEPPRSVTAGTPFSLAVEAEDSSGNLLTSFNGPMTLALAINPGGATLGGTVTATAINGVATFTGVTLTKADPGYQLDVSGAGLVEGLTNAVAVTPAAASNVVITQQPPSSVTAGTGFGLQAAIEDTYGNVVTSATNTVSVALASNPGGTSLGGTLAVTASQGLATFSGLTLTKAATGYTFQVSSNGLGASLTGSMTVTAGTATGLLITQEPTSVVVKTAFSLVVEAVDAYGNLVTSDNNTVTIAPGNNPSGATLGGTKSLKFVDGVATFSGLTLNRVGTAYTILISSKNLTGTTTDPFNVTAS